MSASGFSDIRGIIFDLDGTLYVSDSFATAINTTAALYIAEIRQISLSEAELMMGTTRQRFLADNGTVPTLSAIATELGGNIRDIHSFFVANLQPEDYLERNQQVINLLKRLAEQFAIYVYTNNNRQLTSRIMGYLGLDNDVSGIFTIDDEWRAKPDEIMVSKILAQTDLTPQTALFVGDRYDVDLRVPEQLGCSIYLSQSIEQLLRLEALLLPAVRNPCADKPVAPACPLAAQS